MTPNLFLLDETRAWLLRAAEDLAAAAVLMTPVTLRSALFHCQQAAEKSLKAFLTWHQRPFPRTHNLTVLSGLCAELDESLDVAIAPSLALTRFAVAMRYPGEVEEPSTVEVDEWLAVARSIFDAICSRLPRETHPDHCDDRG
jgi:HEPN domain-containing protein